MSYLKTLQNDTNDEIVDMNEDFHGDHPSIQTVASHYFSNLRKETRKI